MQLKKKNMSVKDALAVATCSLLAHAPQEALATATEGDWDFDFSLLDYQEVDRVRVVEWDVKSKWQYNDDAALNFTVVSDSMTGATPSGASVVPGAQAQTSTTASGTVVASGLGEAAGNYLDPLVDFVDRRNGLGVDWERVFSRSITTNVGGSYSIEDDYSSMGVNGGLGIDLNNKLTRVSVGLAWIFDTVSPNIQGGPPPEGEQIGARTRFAYEDGEKLIVDKGLEITQVLNRRTVTKLSYVTGTTDGYLSDPYKIVTVKNNISGLPKSYYYEKRPNSRARDALNWEYMHQMAGGAVFNSYYRFFWDDWDITSHTLDMRYRIDFATTQYVQLHARYYEQSAAKFYTPNLTEDEERNLPEYMSSDYRLDKLKTQTIGLKYGFKFSQFGHFRIRFEKMSQTGTEGDFKELEARILHAAISMKFGR